MAYFDLNFVPKTGRNKPFVARSKDLKPEAYGSLPGNILMKDSKGLIITPSFDGNGDITSFVVVDEMGTSYYFNTLERTTLQLSDNPDLYGSQPPYTLTYNFNSSTQVAALYWGVYKAAMLAIAA